MGVYLQNKKTRRLRLTGELSKQKAGLIDR